MLVSEIYLEIRNECGLTGNTTKVSDDFLLTGVNLDYGETVMDILRVKTDFNFQAEEATTTLKSTSGLVEGDNGFNGEYSFPSNLIRPVRVELSYDGDVWTPATFYDVADALGGSEHDEDDTEGKWSQTNPFVRFERDSFFIRPVKTTSGDITNGIHIWYEKRQTALTALDTPAFEPNFHRVLVYKGALRIMRKFWEEYKDNQRNDVEMQLLKLNNSMLQFYKDRFKKQFQMKPLFENFK